MSFEENFVNWIWAERKITFSEVETCKQMELSCPTGEGMISYSYRVHFNSLGDWYKDSLVSFAKSDCFHFTWGRGLNLEET